MKRLLLLLLLLGLLLVRQAPAATPLNGEYVMLVGGPSLMVWEKYKLQPHDHWWANFIRAARIRTEQIRAQAPDAKNHVARLPTGLQRSRRPGKTGLVWFHRIRSRQV